MPDAQGKEHEISGIAEIWYENEAAMQAAMASPQAQLANESLALFVDMSKTQIIPVDEYKVI